MSNEREIMIDDYNDNYDAEVQTEGDKHQFHLPVSSVSSKVQTFLEYIYGMDDESAREDLYEIIDRFLGQEQQSGDADDFHNLAVELARKDEYLLACQVLECGFRLFPKNVDLLADYLQYGVSCNKIDECKKIYRILTKIPRRRWTWRGFAFLVEYLQFLIDRSDSDKDIDAKEKEMLEVIKDFRKQFPYSEDSYRIEAGVYHVLDPEKEADTLKLALENVRVAPKCALRYADLLFERGLYEEAADAIKRGISDATQTQSSVNEGYIYYLSALCKIATAQKNGTEISLNETEINGIYSDFNIALSKFQSIKNSYTDVIKTKTNTIINKTGVEVDSTYELLYECIEG